MTNQQIFNKVAKHLIRQGITSEDANNFCQYRGPNGLKCAIGCLIPDHLYDPKWDNENFELALIAAVIGLYEHRELLVALQAVHDREYVCDWTWALVRCAEAFDLDPSAAEVKG